MPEAASQQFCGSSHIIYALNRYQKHIHNNCDHFFYIFTQVQRQQTTHINVDFMLAHRLQYWPNIASTCHVCWPRPTCDYHTVVVTDAEDGVVGS